MSGHTRRGAIGQAVGTGLTALLGPTVVQGQTPLVRHNATSTAGKAMLRIYADAVRAMMAKDPKDPLSWTFQWYIHAIPTNTNKAQALNTIFAGEPPAKRALAERAWDSCEPHFSGDSDNFLPWHRIYLARFEAIIRKVSGKPQFTLPYWNYTAPGAARALPPEFRQPGHAVWGPLHRPNRRPTSNNGQPIDSWLGGFPLNLEAMRSVHYSDDGADAGFCANLDGGLHGSVHGNVGNSQGMGRVPWAANDPVFWLHHCNIDRVWASWNQAGGKNPTDAAFLAQPFPFADANGVEVNVPLSDVMSLPQVGYTYDSYLPRPAGSPPFPAAAPGGFSVVKHAETQAASGPVQLGAAASTVTLTTASPAGFAPNAGFSAQMQALPPARTVYLRLIGVESNAELSGGYDVYLNLPQGETPSRSSPAYVGAVSFFGTGMAHDHAAMRAGPAPKPRTLSFRITPAARRSGFAAAPQVTFVPIGEIEAGAAPRVARVEIVSQ